MARRNAVQNAIEKAKAEIAFQQRLIDALEATQKAQTTTKRSKKSKPEALARGAAED